MSHLRSMFVVFFFAIGFASAQSRQVVVDTPDVDPAVRGAFVGLPPDGGCTLQVMYGGTVGDAGIAPTAQTWPFNGPRCGVARSAIAQASYRDVGVGDGGVP